MKKSNQENNKETMKDFVQVKTISSYQIKKRGQKRTDEIVKVIENKLKKAAIIYEKKVTNKIVFHVKKEESSKATRLIGNIFL